MGKIPWARIIQDSLTGFLPCIRGRVHRFKPSLQIQFHFFYYSTEGNLSGYRMFACNILNNKAQWVVLCLFFQNICLCFSFSAEAQTTVPPEMNSGMIE
ncbi:uncharacterized protein METZ01_LOCUS470629, partial [marine metagenome]